MTTHNRLWPRVFYLALMFCIPALLWLALARVSAVSNLPGSSELPGKSRLQVKMYPAQAANAGDDPARPLAPTVSPDSPAYIPGEVLVGVRGAPLLPPILAESVNISVGEAIDLRGLSLVQEGIGIEQVNEENISGFVLYVPVGEEQRIVEQLSASPEVIFAVLNWRAYAADETTPSPHERMSETPYTVDDDLYREEQWYLQRIGASRAWSAISANGASQSKLTVAVIDTGIDFAHPEFAGRVLQGRNYVSPTLLPHDDSGHGTHVAGVIGAATNNHSGIAGLSASVDLLPLKVLDADNSGSTLDVANAIRFAADEGAEIINLSLQITQSTPVLAAAVSYASGRGALIIAAVGNQYGEPVTFPAAYAEVMAVAGTTYNDQWAFYNAQGGAVELLAPGGEGVTGIRSAWPSVAASKCQFNSYLLHEGGGYCRSIGTSSAAAVATGAAALAWSIRPDLQAFAVRAALRETGQPVASVNNVSGARRLDVHAAVRRLLPSGIHIMPPSIVRVAATGSDPLVDVLHIDNPSSSPITWSVNLSGVAPWLGTGDGTTIPMTGVVSGPVRYGAPARLPLVTTISGTSVGTHQAILQVSGQRGDGSQVIRFVQAKVSVYSDTMTTMTTTLHLPQITGPYSWPGEEPTGSFRWELPWLTPRTYHGMADNSSFGLTLPFTFTVAGRSYTNTRVFSDGYLLFPVSNLGGAQTNRCLANDIGPELAIYGWWANLNPGAVGEHVSSFMTDPDRFVIEFADVPTAAGVSPAYVVSFQIVLHRSGRIELNYRDAPQFIGAPPRMTAGVTIRNGRFYNQIFCATADVELGTVPRPFQSVVLYPEEIY